MIEARFDAGTRCSSSTVTAIMALFTQHLMDLFFNSKLHVWPPDLVNYNYVITFYSNTQSHIYPDKNLLPIQVMYAHIYRYMYT